MEKYNHKMKRLLYYFALLGILTSCGPHRMKCGPGRRCIVENTTKSKPDVPQQKIS
jgi:hypothetical protein